MIHTEDSEIVGAPDYEIPLDSEIAQLAIKQLQDTEKDYYEKQQRLANQYGGGQEAFFDSDMAPDEVRVPAFAYHYWGKRLGYDCWDDPAFRREFARDNPGFKRTVKPRKVTVSVRAPVSSIKRYTKKYSGEDDE